MHMPTKVVLASLFFGVCFTLSLGCGKVTQQVGAKNPGTKAYATLKAQIALDPQQNVLNVLGASAQSLSVPYSDLSTKDSKIVVAVYGIKHSGGSDLLAWGQGYRPSWSSLEETLSSYSLNRKGKKMKAAEEGVAYLKYVPGSKPYWDLEVNNLTVPYPYIVVATSAGTDRPVLLSAVDATALTAGMILLAPVPSFYESFIVQMLRLAQSSSDTASLKCSLDTDDVHGFYPPSVWHGLNLSHPLFTIKTDNLFQADDMASYFSDEEAKVKRKHPWQAYVDLVVLHQQALPIYLNAIENIKLSPALSKWFTAQSHPDNDAIKNAEGK